MATPKTHLPSASLTRDEALALLESRAQIAQSELAGHTDAGGEVLHYLAENGAVATRRAVAANPAAEARTNFHLSEDEDEEVRVELARKIARLMPNLDVEESRHIHALTIDTLERLAKDQVVRVRAVLAEELKTLDCVPKFIVQTLAKDVASLVAAPILQYSPLLSDADLLEVIAAGRAEEVLTAIASRRPLSGQVANAVIGTLDIPSIAALLANPDAKVRGRTMDKLIEHAEKVEALQVPLVMRTDLSKRAIWRLASFVGASLIEQLMMRYGLDEDIKHQLNKELRARLQEDSQKESTPLDKAKKDVAAALEAGKLDEAFVDRCANAGQRDAVVLSLAALAKVPEAIVRKIIQSGSAKPAIALVWHAGLSMRVAFKIQS
ncbi:MAG TPA: DUF2336 domain-containing protein, partial [Bradyrhizobium sp.]